VIGTLLIQTATIHNGIHITHILGHWNSFKNGAKSTHKNIHSKNGNHSKQAENQRCGFPTLFEQLLKLCPKEYSKKDKYSPYKDAVEVAFCATIGDVTPVLVFLQFPQPSKPIQHTDLKLP